ncbi:MAG: hypothetical protein CMC08_10165 [Flavobacteriaceae bacterium]|nr:hypothetical protein [Flavobacteriaceae bacterium]
MIKFFRNIRKQTISENRFSKYLLYAIGEIVLVVIGILIALQINNWNERQKIEAVQETYLEQLLLDIKSDRAYYAATIAQLQQVAQGYENYKTLFEKPNLEPTTVLSALQQIDYGSVEVEFSTNTFQTLVSTGDIKILPEHLRTELTSYFGKQTHIKAVSSNNNEGANNILQKASSIANPDMFGRLRNQPKLQSYLNIQSNFPQLILELEAYMLWKQIGENVIIESFQELQQDATELIELITAELEA